MPTVETVPLYVRIPTELRKRLDDAAPSSPHGYARKGDLAELVRRLLAEGLDRRAAPLPERLADLAVIEPRPGWQGRATKRFRKERKAKRKAKGKAKRKAKGKARSRRK